jgi:hypothetical protein
MFVREQAAVSKQALGQAAVKGDTVDRFPIACTG